MSLIYDIKKWIDHVVETPYKRRLTNNSDGTFNIEKVPGQIIRQGTPRNAENYNNMEEGIYACSAYGLFLVQKALQTDRDVEELRGETKNVVISKGAKGYPFDSGVVTVALEKKRGNNNYHVRLAVVDASSGFVENVEAFDKQLNGFKLRYKGSAESVTVKYTVVGGLS